MGDRIIWVLDRSIWYTLEYIGIPSSNHRIQPRYIGIPTTNLRIQPRYLGISSRIHRIHLEYIGIPSRNLRIYPEYFGIPTQNFRIQHRYRDGSSLALFEEVFFNIFFSKFKIFSKFIKKTFHIIFIRSFFNFFLISCELT